MLQRPRRATLLYSFFISNEISGRMAGTINGETNLVGRVAGLSRRPARRGCRTLTLLGSSGTIQSYQQPLTLRFLPIAPEFPLDFSFCRELRVTCGSLLPLFLFEAPVSPFANHEQPKTRPLKSIGCELQICKPSVLIFMQIGGVGRCILLDSRTVVSFHSVNILLNEVECRVLGALIEKEIPVMNLDEAAVRQALHSLDGQSLVRSVSASDSRVTKYEHRLQETFNFYRHEVAILCVLLLRGPQTPGELRTRAERMHPFDDLSAVQSSLQHLMKREPPLAKVLPRQPGTKESRYAHLLSGDVEVFESKLDIPAITNASSPDGERIALLEKEVAELRNNAADFQKEIADLRQQFAQFKKQFE